MPIDMDEETLPLRESVERILTKEQGKSSLDEALPGETK